MEFDAFTGGVDFCGLRSKNDIKILICYMLCTLDAPFAKEDILRVLQDQALANYFEINDAFSSLEEMGNVTKDGDGNYRVTATGRQISDSLYAVLPLSVREKAIQAASQLRAQAKVERENAEALKKQLDGKTVTVKTKAGAGGKLFGSVTAKEVAQALSQQFSIEADKKKISLESEIKAFGTFSFEYKLLGGVVAAMKVMVTE